MAKKILSILCALAMMVTMVSVAAFSASAAPEGYADFDGLADMTLTVDTDGNYGNNSGWYAKVGSGRYESAYFGSTALLADQTLMSVSSDEYAIDGEFSITYYLQRKQYDGGNGTQKDGSVAYGFLNKMVLGDLEVMFTSNNSPTITCDVSYDGQQLNSVTNSWGQWTEFSAGSADHTAILADMQGAFAQGSYDSTGARMLIEVKVAYSNGNVTVSFGQPNNTSKQSTVTAAISDADFSAAALTLTLAEKNNKGSHLYGFSGTYKTVSTGGEGGETPDPEVPDPEVPTSGTFDALSDMTVSTRAYKNGSTWYNSLGSAGYYSDYYSSDAIVASQGMITAESGPYNVGDEFSISYNVIRGDYPGGAGTQPDGSVAHGYHNIVVLGDLKIELYSGNTPFITIDAYYGDQKIIDGATTSTWSDNNYGTKINTTDQEFLDVFSFNRNADDTAYVGELYNKISTAASGGANTYYAANKRKVETTITYNNGTLTVTYGAIGVATPFTATAQLTNADFSDANLSVSVAEINNRGTILYDFEGTYTPYVAPTTDPLAPTGAAPTLNSNLTLNVAFGEAGTLAGKGYTDVKVNASIGNLGEEYDLTQKTINGVTYDVAAIDFLTPDLFGEDITIEVTAKDSTEADASYTTTYSVKQYCKNMMDNDSSSAELKALCMALLQFGGKAQALDGSDTITADMSSYIDAYAPTAWTKGTAAWTYTGDQAIKFSGSNLNFADEIGINVYFTADGDASDYKVVSTFGTVSDVVVDPENSSLFMATIRISSSMLSEQTDITVKDAATNEVVSETFTLSVEDWVNYNIDKMDDDDEKACASALMTYGDAAAAYGATLN